MEEQSSMADGGSDASLDPTGKLSRRPETCDSTRRWGIPRNTAVWALRFQAFPPFRSASFLSLSVSLALSLRFVLTSQSWKLSLPPIRSSISFSRLLGNSLVRDSGSFCRLLPPQPRNSPGLSKVKITFLLALSGLSTRRARLNTFNMNIKKSKLNTPDTLPNYYFTISGADFVLWRFHELLQNEKTILRHYCINIALP